MSFSNPSHVEQRVKVKELIGRLGKGQSQAAQSMRVSETSLSHWLRGYKLSMPSVIKAGQAALRWYTANKDAKAATAKAAPVDQSTPEQRAQVKELIGRLGKTQNQAAQSMRVSGPSLSHWLRGQNLSWPCTIKAGQAALRWYTANKDAKAATAKAAPVDQSTPEQRAQVKELIGRLGKTRNQAARSMRLSEQISLSHWLRGQKLSSPSVIKAGQAALRWYAANKDAKAAPPETAPVDQSTPEQRAQVKELIGRLGKSQTQAAQSMRVSNACLSNWLCGHKLSCPSTIKAGQAALRWYAANSQNSSAPEGCSRETVDRSEHVHIKVEALHVLAAAARTSCHAALDRTSGAWTPTVGDGVLARWKGGRGEYRGWYRATVTASLTTKRFGEPLLALRYEDGCVEFAVALHHVRRPLGKRAVGKRVHKLVQDRGSINGTVTHMSPHIHGAFHVVYDDGVEEVMQEEELLDRLVCEGETLKRKKRRVCRKSMVAVF